MNIPTLHQHQCVTPPIATLRHIKRTLGDSAVGYLDKNNGLLFIACKRWYWYRNKAMFLDDHEHYEFISEDQSDILMESFQEFHSKHGLGKLHRFDTSKSIPYSYILVKAKDINRSRPIVSYYLHPLKKNIQHCIAWTGFHAQTEQDALVHTLGMQRHDRNTETFPAGPQKHVRTTHTLHGVLRRHQKHVHLAPSRCNH